MRSIRRVGWGGRTFGWQSRRWGSSSIDWPECELFPEEPVVKYRRKITVDLYLALILAFK